MSAGLLLLELVLVGFLAWVAWVAFRPARQAEPAVRRQPAAPPPRSRQVVTEGLPSRPPSAAGAPLALDLGGESFPQEIVGESHHQAQLRDIARGVGPVRLDRWAVLRPEDTNPHDPRAVRVEIQGHHVGYLSRADAARARRALGASLTADAGFWVPARIYGGGDRAYGVWLALDLIAEAARSRPTATGRFEGAGRFSVPVVGVNRHQEHLRALLGDPAIPVSAEVDAVLLPRQEEERWQVEVHIAGAPVGELHAKRAAGLVEKLGEAAIRARTEGYGAKARIQGQGRDAEGRPAPISVSLDLEP